MPRLSPDAAELIVSPDGVWACALDQGSLKLFALQGRGKPTLGEAKAARGTGAGTELTVTSEPYRTIECHGKQGRIGFLSADRLLHIYVESTPGGESGEEGVESSALIAAELLTTPDLRPMGPLVRVAGAQRIVGLGLAGAVVAPMGPGADILIMRGNDLILQRTFMRSEVRSAVAAPDRRFLLEQREGYEVWDPTTRSAVLRLVLQSRQPIAQIGYVAGGKLIWALSHGPPAHLEIFRASDGRKMFEISQPGTALMADAGPGRVVVAVEERSGHCFLDVDATTGALTRHAVPAELGKVVSFVVRPLAAQPEVLAWMGTEEPNLLRLRLPVLSARLSDDNFGVRKGARLTGRATGLERAEAPAPLLSRPSTFRGESRPEPRPARVQFPEEEPERSERGFAPSESRHEAEEDAEPPSLELSLSTGSGAQAMGMPGSRDPFVRYRPLLERSFDPAASAAAQSWELLRWALRVLSQPGEPMVPPPDGELLLDLSSRLRLNPVAVRIVSLLYAGHTLLGLRPKGMRPVELAACLAGLFDEPTVLAELSPMGTLRKLGLLGLSRSGHLRLQHSMLRHLAGVPCPGLAVSGTADKEALATGLYAYVGPLCRTATLVLRQSILRLDVLSEPEPLSAFARLKEQALLNDAVIVIDGVPGLSFPAFGPSPLLTQLRPALLGLDVPVLVCAMPDAMGALGLPARALPKDLLVQTTSAPAPLAPSAPLPTGASWRAPLLPVSAAYLDPGAQTGQLEIWSPADRRAAIVLGPSAPPESYAASAYLAARDGAVLLADVELTSARATVLALLLRQLPVEVTAFPAGGPGADWPAVLAPFAV